METEGLEWQKEASAQSKLATLLKKQDHLFA